MYLVCIHLTLWPAIFVRIRVEIRPSQRAPPVTLRVLCTSRIVGINSRGTATLWAGFLWTEILLSMRVRVTFQISRLARPRLVPRDSAKRGPEGR